VKSLANPHSEKQQVVRMKARRYFFGTTSGLFVSWLTFFRNSVASSALTELVLQGMSQRAAFVECKIRESNKRGGLDYNGMLRKWNRHLLERSELIIFDQ